MCGQADVVEPEVAGTLGLGDHAAPVAGLAERGAALGQGEDTHLAAVAGGRQGGGACTMVALAGVQRRIGRRLKADQPCRSAAVVDRAVHLPHRNEDPFAGFDRRAGIALAQRAAALQHHDHVFRFVVQMLGELLARLVQAVVEGEPARAHLRVHDAPVAALAHAEGAARVQVEELHQAGLAAVSANSEVVRWLPPPPGAPSLSHYAGRSDWRQSGALPLACSGHACTSWRRQRAAKTPSRSRRSS